MKRICYFQFILKQDKVIEQDLLANNVLNGITEALMPLFGVSYQKLYEFKYLSQSMKSYLQYAHENPNLIDPRRAVANYIAGMSDRFCLEALAKLRPTKIASRAA